MHEVYKDGAADKDGRIKPGDMIVTVDGKAMKECTHKDALRVLRVTKDKVCCFLMEESPFLFSSFSLLFFLHRSKSLLTRSMILPTYTRILILS